MKREIKFRGLRTDSKGFVYGSFIHNSVDCPCIIDNDADQYEIIPESVGEFTGLTDKNKVRVFDDDKIKYLGAIGVVYYESDTAMYMVRFENNGSVWSFNSIDQGFEVIGNIHEKEVVDGK